MATPPDDPEGLKRVRYLLTGEEPARRVGKYRIVREVGRGGMGVVYEAVDPDLGRRVALKTLNDEGSNPKCVELLRREATTAAKLKHPNIVPVHEVGSVADESGKIVHFIAMDFVEGDTLARQASRMPKRKRLEVLENLAQAVAFAHEQGVVHRDLKPQNVLLESTTVSGEGPGWRVYLTDFGLAKQMTGDDLTRSGTVLGTPHYMAPEQVRGQMSKMGPWTDVWALGVMLYEMVTRKSPFDGPNAPAVYERIVSHDPKPPRKVERAVHPDVETICLKALEKEPAKRYPTAAGFAGDLERYLRDEPISTRPIGAATRLWRTVKRRPAAWSLGPVAALALAVAGIVWIGAVRKERRLAETRRIETARTDELRRRLETSLHRLSAHWQTIAEKKRELRLLRVPADQGRRALEDAVRAVDSHVVEWPDDAQGYYVRAQGRMWLGNFAGAETDIHSALERRPHFAPARRLLGTLKVEAYQQVLFGPPESERRRAKKSAPLLQEALEAFRRADADADDGRFGLVRTREDQVTERLSRVFQAYYQTEDFEAARKILEEGLVEYKSEEYALWMGSVSGPGEEALRWQTQAIEWAPGFERAHLLRGVTYMNQGRWDDAERDYDLALEIFPNRGSTYYNRAMVKALRKDLAGAVADYDRSIALDDSYAPAFMNRGTIREDLGDRAAARADFERALRLDDEFAEAWYNLGRLEQLQGDSGKALAHYDRALQLRKDLPDAHFNRAILRYRNGDKVGSIADFEAALAVGPANWSGREEAQALLDDVRKKP